MAQRRGGAHHQQAVGSISRSRCAAAVAGEVVLLLSGEDAGLRGESGQAIGQERSGQRSGDIQRLRRQRDDSGAGEQKRQSGEWLD